MRRFFDAGAGPGAPGGPQQPDAAAEKKTLARALILAAKDVRPLRRNSGAEFCEFAV